MDDTSAVSPVEGTPLLCDHREWKSTSKAGTEQVVLQAPRFDEDNVEHPGNRNAGADVGNADSKCSDKCNDVILSSTEAADEKIACCSTPKHCIFDPFAPGPEKLCVAPKKRAKFVPECLPRQLPFKKSALLFAYELYHGDGDATVNAVLR